MRDTRNDPIVEFITPEGITAYPWIFEKNPEADDQGVNWYGLMLKFPKEEYQHGKVLLPAVDQDELNEMRRQFMVAARQGWPKPEALPEDFGSPLRDGDKFDRANNRKKNSELEGFWYMSLKTKNQPGCVEAPALTDILTRDGFYSGCIARGSGIAFAYENKGNTGVSTRLTNVCKMKEGVRIGGAPAAKDQFKQFGRGGPTANDTDADELL